MSTYLLISGVVINVVILLIITSMVFVWFIWPAIEAVSMTMYYRRISKYYPDVKMKGLIRVFASCYEPFGRRFETMRCNYGYWRSISDWHVFKPDESNEPSNY
ncbi:hypothetical protein QBS69_14420 [Cronobacter sakazakii]|uniref:hypothetical protein n=1 Tax=Cronobacter sakazakii TaxID=28141 RepID=UPI002811F33F|nr:hypothetical protein [Cronobacter sakazakii]MDQ9175274.1 hypothetical protein [Cronobacter sakazakii]